MLNKPAKEPRRAALSSTTEIPQKHHLDKRALDLAAKGGEDGSPDDLLETREVADWLGMSTQFLEIGRCRGFGPHFLRISPRRIRYRRRDILLWLAEREFASTAEYAAPKRKGGA